MTSSSWSIDSCLENEEHEEIKIDSEKNECGDDDKDEIIITIGKGIHECIKETISKSRSPFVFKRALINILKSENHKVKTSFLPNLRSIMTLLIHHVLSEFELFSIDGETLLDE